MKLDLSKISNQLLSFQKEEPNLAHELKISSVIMPFYISDSNSDEIILTKRSDKLKSHAGQISFPGGKFDPSDITLEETALREWEEETGSSRQNLKVLGQYKAIDTRTGYHITPFVAVYEGDFQFSINVNEVDFIFRLSLKEMEELPFYTIQFRDMIGNNLFVYYFDHPRGLLWGATCHLLYHFLRDFCGFKREPIITLPNLSGPPFFDPRKNT